MIAFLGDPVEFLEFIRARDRIVIMLRQMAIIASSDVRVFEKETATFVPECRLFGKKRNADVYDCQLQC